MAGVRGWGRAYPWTPPRVIAEAQRSGQAVPYVLVGQRAYIHGPRALCLHWGRSAEWGQDTHRPPRAAGGRGERVPSQGALGGAVARRVDPRTSECTKKAA